LSVAQPESDMISHHSIRYFENGISFGCVGSTSFLFLLGFLLLGFLFAMVIVRVVYPVEHIKEILFSHYFYNYILFHIFESEKALYTNDYHVFHIFEFENVVTTFLILRH